MFPHDPGVWPRIRRRENRGLVTIVLVAMGLSFVLAVAPRPRHAEGEPARPWAPAIQQVDAALARHDVRAAERAWHEARAAAWSARRWDGLLALGDASLRMGEAAQVQRLAEPRARELYLAALFQARLQDAFDGVLRSVEGLAALGDRETVERGLQVAEDMAHRQGQAQAVDRVLALRERLLARRRAGPPIGPDPLVIP